MEGRVKWRQEVRSQACGSLWALPDLQRKTASSQAVRAGSRETGQAAALRGKMGEEGPETTFALNVIDSGPSWRLPWSPAHR